jgi:hypothetical protein
MLKQTDGSSFCCTAMEKLALPSSIGVIGEGCFLYLPNSVRFVSGLAFAQNCRNVFHSIPLPRISEFAVRYSRMSLGVV